MLPPAIRSHWDAMLLVRELRKSLLKSKDRWKSDADENGSAVLSHGDFRIVLERRGLRLLDAIHLYQNDAEVWLPLMPRLRLRATARMRLIEDAERAAKSNKSADARTRNRRSRARSA
jgi:hypothetical protein